MTYPKVSTTENQLLPWVREEFEHLDIPGHDGAVEGGDTTAAREALLERRARIADNYESGLIDRGTRDAKVAEIAADIMLLEAADKVVRLPDPADIDWSDPAGVNTVLRAFWEYVELGPDMKPVRALWRFPHWRAA